MTPAAPPRCHDTQALRCVRPLGHDGAHRNGVAVWQTRPVTVPTWRANLTNRDNTRAVLSGPPL